ncbi:M23 family metallopeptidase [Arthrobacter sp. RCC_34]|uniref:M23 family metallopeptidase n=1 Tax=Arthrobacter sp. RCC_34 TaxID=3239230 RepID=UPI003524A59B
MSGKKAAGGAVAAVLAVPLFLVGSLVLLGGNSAQAGACGAPAAAVVSGKDVPKEIAGFSGVQLKNAAILMDQAKKLGMPVSAQLLVVQAAIGESTLRAIDYTDAVGTVNGVAITIGILQQDESYGVRADRLDVAKAGAGFLSRLKNVQGWESLDPSIAIHRVQRNADENHYTKFRAQAVQVVEALSGAKVTGGECSAPGGKVIGEVKGHWANPLPGGVVTSPYGPRPGMLDPLGRAFHFGLDLSHPLTAGTEVAATDMKITVATDVDGGTGAGTHVKGISLDRKFTLSYSHMEPGSLRVKVGDVVAAGTPLGTEGASGNVTGRHLHFEVFLGAYNDPWSTHEPTTDPEPILRSKGLL